MCCVACVELHNCTLSKYKMVNVTVNICRILWSLTFQVKALQVSERDVTLYMYVTQGVQNVLQSSQLMVIKKLAICNGRDLIIWFIACIILYIHVYSCKVWGHASQDYIFKLAAILTHFENIFYILQDRLSYLTVFQHRIILTD